MQADARERPDPIGGAYHDDHFAQQVDGEIVADRAQLRDVADHQPLAAEDALDLELEEGFGGVGLGWQGSGAAQGLMAAGQHGLQQSLQRRAWRPFGLDD